MKLVQSCPECLGSNSLHKISVCRVVRSFVAKSINKENCMMSLDYVGVTGLKTQSMVCKYALKCCWEIRKVLNGVFFRTAAQKDILLWCFGTGRRVFKDESL